MAAGYGMEDREAEVRVPVGKEFSLLDRFWDKPSLLSNGNRGLFPVGKVAGW
jgi:hypothetical protein